MTTKTIPLNFDIVFSADDFFISLDWFDLISGCKEFKLIDGCMVFCNGNNIFKTCRLPSEMLPLLNRPVVFAKVGEKGVVAAVELPRKIDMLRSEL